MIKLKLHKVRTELRHMVVLARFFFLLMTQKRKKLRVVERKPNINILTLIIMK